MNIKYVFTLCLMWVTALTLTSCLGGNDDSDGMTYDDVAITAFSIRSVNRTFHKTSSTGEDSTYVTAISSNLPVFTIDHYQQKIYNTTPLPSECDLTRVLVTIAAKNNGGIVLKSMISDSLFYYNSTDSIDFSKTRELRVYASNGSGFRAYTVDIKMSGDGSSSMQWKQMPAGTEMPVTPSAGWAFKLNDAGDGINASNDDWATQTVETLDTDAKLLPQRNASFVCWSQSNGTTYALLVGDNDLQKSAVVWRKVISDGLVSSWTYMPLSDSNPYYLPKGQYYWLLPYTGNSVLAIAADGTVYQSRDQGITWKTNSSLKLPISNITKASTKGEGDIWLLEGNEAGTIWYGKMTE